MKSCAGGSKLGLGFGLELGFGFGLSTTAVLSDLTLACDTLGNHDWKLVFFVP
jgi:hypothetical protein